MPIYTVQGPDGRTYKIEGPPNATPEQLGEVIASQAQQQPSPSFFDRVGRQVGLTARYAAEGLPQIADLIASPLKMATDKVAGMVRGEPNYRSPTLSQMGGQVSDAAGLPAPQTKQERIVGEATKTGFSAAGGLGLFGGASRLPVGEATKATLSTLTANPASQVAAGVGAGGAGQMAKEAGANPLTQFAAALAGGVAAPMALNASNSAINTVSRMLNPANYELKVANIARQAGVDWDSLSGAAREQLRKDLKSAVYSDQPIDSDALRRLADFRRIGAVPRLGDITQNPRDVTQGENLTRQLANQQVRFGAGADLPEVVNDNAKRVLTTLERSSNSPLDAYQTGEKIIGSVKSTDAAMSKKIDGLYKTAQAAAGREIPLDSRQFVNEAFSNLDKTNRSSFLPAEVRDILNKYSKGFVEVDGKQIAVPFNVDTIDQLKTILSTASRSTKDGNVKAAVGAVYDALENVRPTSAVKIDPSTVTGAQASMLRAADELPASALKAFDDARKGFRSQKQWQESANFIKDALDGAEPDKFVQKHVIGADVSELAKLKNAYAKSPEIIEAVKKQMVDYLMTRGGADSDVTRFSSNGLNNALKALGDRKLNLFFDKSEIENIKSAVNVAKYMQSQPIGSAVNNSNTANAAMGKITDLLMRSTAVPGIGPLITQPATGAVLSLQARPIMNAAGGVVRRQPTSPLIPLLATVPQVVQNN